MNTAFATVTEAPAEKATTADAKPGKPKRKMKLKHKLLLIITCLFMMVFLRTGFIFVIIAMMPAIVTYYIDRSPRPHLFKSVFALNLSGLLPFVGRMLVEGPMSALIPIMQSVDTWIVIYGAALTGYLMVAAAPLVAHVLISRFQAGQVEQIESSLKKIEREWGAEVMKFSKHQEEA